MKLHNMDFEYVANDRLPEKNLEELIKYLSCFSTNLPKIAVYGMAEAGQKISARLLNDNRVELTACIDVRPEVVGGNLVITRPDELHKFTDIDLVINTAPPQYVFEINSFILSENSNVDVLNLYDLKAFVLDERNWDYSYRILVQHDRLKGVLAEYHKDIAKSINQRIDDVLQKIKKARTVSHQDILEELVSEQKCLGRFLEEKLDEAVHSGNRSVENLLALADKFPFFVIARDAAAVLLVKKRLFLDAVKAFEPTIEMYPCCRFSLQKLAELYALSGRVKDSIQFARKGLYYFPDSYELKELLCSLEHGDLSGIEDKWSAREVRPALKSRKVRLRCAVPIWGKEFIKIFMEFGLSSLLASGNIPFAAKEYDVCFDIYSYENEFESIKSYPQWDILQSLVSVCLIDIDSVKENFEDKFSFSNKFSCMSMCQNHALQRSAEEGRALFLPLGDSFFANNFLKNALAILDMGYDTLFVSGLRASFPGIREKVRSGLMKDGILAASTEAFSKAGLEVMHPSSLQAKMDKFTPVTPNYFVYEDASCVMYSIFGNNPLFIHPPKKVLQMDTTLDADLPYRATDGGLGRYAFADDVEGMLLFEIVDEMEKLGFHEKRSRNLNECTYWLYGRTDPLSRYFGTRMMMYNKDGAGDSSCATFRKFIQDSLDFVL
ncbi:hypothetical protein [Maridesulfovibrio frigidus]|uniref:hypothetical protein n=1 Tax=Maridesulfovibrio frigidus TaxID=340956 RepID=UPI0012EB94A5|nr:hypothetical protein [Maridesulfovibrio frigidus]